MNDKSETYIGVVIGILSVTVLLLLSAILLILRKNRQKIFSKHSSKFSTMKIPCSKSIISNLFKTILYFSVENTYGEEKWEPNHEGDASPT